MPRFLLNFPDLACAKINPSHPLAVGLERFLVAEGTSLRDLVYNELFAPTGTPIVTSMQQGGAVRNNSTTGANYWPVGVKSETKDSFSILSYFRPEAHHATSVNNHFVRDSATNSCALGYAGSGATRWSARVGGTTITYAVTPTVGVHYTAAVTASGGSSTLYVDGVLRASGAAGANALTSPWVWGKNGTSANGPDLSIFAGLVYNRALTAGEVILLHLDPFAPLRSKSSFLYSVYYAITAVTITLSSATLTLSPQSLSTLTTVVKSISAVTLSLSGQSLPLRQLRTIVISAALITLTTFAVVVRSVGGAISQAFIKIGNWIGLRIG